MLSRTIILLAAVLGGTLQAAQTTNTNRVTTPIPARPLITNTVVVTITPRVTNVVVTNTVVAAPAPGAPVVNPPGISPFPSLSTNVPPGVRMVPTRGTNITATPSGTVTNIVTTPPSFPSPVVAPPGFGNAPNPGQLPGLPVPGRPGSTAPTTGAPPAVVTGRSQDDPMEQIIKSGTVQLPNTPLEQIFDIYSEYSGKTILRPSSLPATTTITLKIRNDMTRREVVQALDGVLALNGITMIPIGDKLVKAVQSNTAPQEGAEISKKDAKGLPMADQFVTQVIQLKTIKPSEVSPLFASFTKNPAGITPIDASGILVIRDYASNVKRMLEILEKVDVMPESDYSLEVIPIKYGKVTDLFDTMNYLIGGGGGGACGVGGAAGGTGAGGRTSRRTTPTRPGASGYGGSSSRTTGMGATGVQPFQNQQGIGGSSFGGVGGASGAPGVGSQSSFQDRLRQIVSRAATGGGDVQILSDARIVPDERSNSLLIYASKQDMSMITNIVARVDTLLAQVLIEAIIMEVNLTDTLSMGVSLMQNPKRWGDFTGGGLADNQAGSLTAGRNFLSGLANPGAITNISDGNGGFSYFGKLGGSLEAAVNMVATDSRANVLSRPRIQTSHAVPGNVFLGKSVPYVTGVSDYGGFSGSGYQRSNYQEKEIGINLFVTPFITPEGLVVMEVEQSFDAQAGEVEIDGNPVPVINKRQVTSILTVRDGDTIMLGGFISEDKTKTKGGVPILKDIPFLGAAFRSKNNKDSRTELIVLMRARVLQTPEEAAIVANDERIRSPLLKRADYEIEADNRKRLQKVDDELKRAMEKDYRNVSPPLNTPGSVEPVVTPVK